MTAIYRAASPEGELILFSRVYFSNTTVPVRLSTSLPELVFMSVLLFVEFSMVFVVIDVLPVCLQCIVLWHKDMEQFYFLLAEAFNTIQSRFADTIHNYYISIGISFKHLDCMINLSNGIFFRSAFLKV